jgi:hypothetical protein
MEDQGSGWMTLASTLLPVLASHWQAALLLMTVNCVLAFLLMLARRTDPRPGKVCVFFVTITWEASPPEHRKPQAPEQRKRWFRR